MTTNQLPKGVIITLSEYLDAVRPKVRYAIRRLLDELVKFKQVRRVGIRRALREFRFHFNLRGDIYADQKARWKLEPIIELNEWDDTESIKVKFIYHLCNDVFELIGLAEIQSVLLNKYETYDSTGFVFLESPSTPRFFLIQLGGIPYVLDASDMTDEEAFMAVARWAVNNDPGLDRQTDHRNNMGASAVEAD